MWALWKVGTCFFVCLYHFSSKVQGSWSNSWWIERLQRVLNQESGPCVQVPSLPLTDFATLKKPFNYNGPHVKWRQWGFVPPNSQGHMAWITEGIKLQASQGTKQSKMKRINIIIHFRQTGDYMQSWNTLRGKQWQQNLDTSDRSLDFKPRFKCGLENYFEDLILFW